MAGSLGSRNDDQLIENHEINVTPFIDVMLVLLIIFMVAAPLATVDINVDLPTSSAAPQARPDEPVYLTVKKDLSIALGEEDIAHFRLGQALDARTNADRETRIFLRADSAIAYGDLMNVMNLLRAQGYLKIALVGLEAAVAPLAPAGASGQDRPVP